MIEFIKKEITKDGHDGFDAKDVNIYMIIFFLVKKFETKINK